MALTSLRELPVPRGLKRVTVGGRRNQIGERMRERRKELRLTLRGLGGRVAVVTDGLFDEAWVPDDQELARIEQGRRICSDLELVALARALECTASWLLEGEAAKGEAEPG
jgi:transcriptional regulator with XRE-family HTH domain